MLKDIENEKDVALMVNAFYSALIQNEDMKLMFEKIDLEKHMPHMIAFWEFVLLDKAGYTTNVFDKHVNLPLTEHHFSFWLSTFEKTVHELFKGEKAEMAIQRAQSIGYSFQHKLKQMGKLNNTKPNH